MGEAVANSNMVHSRFRVTVLPLCCSTSIADIGRLRLSKLLDTAHFVVRLTRACLVVKPCLAYFTITPVGMAFYRDIIFVAVLRTFGVRLLYHLHGKGIANASAGTISRLLYRWAFRDAGVIILSRMLFDDIAEVKNGNDCFILPNGVADPGPEGDGDGFSTPMLESRPPTILFFSNMVAAKGPLLLLDALGVVKGKGIPFKAVFAGEWGSSCTEHDFFGAVRKNGLEGMVEYKGPRYDEEKAETFRRSDIMALPTYYPNESFPLVILEAMAHGLPVVSTREGAIPDMVVDGVTGFLVPPRQVAPLADRLALLLTDSALRSSMGGAGRRRFLDRFTMRRFEEKLCAILARCVSDRR